MKITFSVFMNLILTVILLCSVFFMGVTTSQPVQQEYDPWYDVNDDGIIDIYDIVKLTSRYFTTGTPLNKTELLLELQSRMDILEARIPSSRVISISPAAFTAEHDTQTYSRHYASLEGNGTYWANLQLPPRTNITRMTAHLGDYVNDGQIVVELFGFNLTTGTLLSNPLAHVETSIPGMDMEVIILTDNTINDSVIDENCIYGIKVYFTYRNAFLALRAVQIEYEYLA